MITGVEMDMQLYMNHIAANHKHSLIAANHIGHNA
jgi:hypothetical protein